MTKLRRLGRLLSCAMNIRKTARQDSSTSDLTGGVNFAEFATVYSREIYNLWVLHSKRVA